jgi:RNA polymerase sigma-70 factor (ECF subfamily)
MRVNCHKLSSAGVVIDVDAAGEAVVGVKTDEGKCDLETIFKAQYGRIARVIAGIIRDRARAEELAVDVFLRWSRSPKAHGEKAEGWLYRTAVRTGLNELRREMRQSRYENLFGFFNAGRKSPTPEEIRAAQEEREKVQFILGVIQSREAELLVLRSHGFSYDELASTCGLNPASIGTLLARAEQAFRREYIKRYGEQ